jgi:hypothetical protein
VAPATTRGGERAELTARAFIPAEHRTQSAIRLATHGEAAESTHKNAIAQPTIDN